MKGHDVKRNIRKSKPDEIKILNSLYETLAHQLGVKLDSVEINEKLNKTSA